MTSPASCDCVDLLGRARAGDDDARGSLLESHRDYLELLARIQLGLRLQGKADAADVVQETFLEAHRDLPSFRGSTAPEFAGWLRRALARNIANALRHFYGTQARDPRLEKELADDLDRSSQAIATMVAAPISTPSRQAARREDAVRLAEALQSLSPDYRTVLILRYIDGLTFPLVAERMNRSVDSVEKLWVRALAQLRRTMGTDS